MGPSSGETGTKQDSTWDFDSSAREGLFVGQRNLGGTGQKGWEAWDSGSHRGCLITPYRGRGMRNGLGLRGNPKPVEMDEQEFAGERGNCALRVRTMHRRMDIDCQATARDESVRCMVVSIV